MSQAVLASLLKAAARNQLVQIHPSPSFTLTSSTPFSLNPTPLLLSILLFFMSLIMLTIILLARHPKPNHQLLPSILPHTIQHDDLIHIPIPPRLPSSHHPTSNPSSTTSTHTQTQIPSSNHTLLTTATRDENAVMTDDNHPGPETTPAPQRELEQPISRVTLTFGSDKPDVYLKMAAEAHRPPPRCPCVHHIFPNGLVKSAHHHFVPLDSLHPPNATHALTLASEPALHIHEFSSTPTYDSCLDSQQALDRLHAQKHNLLDAPFVTPIVVTGADFFENL